MGYTIERYDVIEAWSIKELSQKIMDIVDSRDQYGWKLQGGICVTQVDGKLLYSQAVRANF